MASKLNVVLVHGAWADGSSWSKVIPLLQPEKFNVTAVQIPLTSLEADIEVTRKFLATQKGPTVLVGHSYGGLVISGAANGAENVIGLVYIAAFSLDEGETLEWLFQQGPPPAGAAQIQPDDNGFLWINREHFAEAFAADVDPVFARVMEVVQKPLSAGAFTTKIGPPAWKHIPAFYLVATNDQMIPPQAEEMMGKRMGGVVHKTPASHSALVSQPEEVLKLILLAAEAADGKSAAAPHSAAIAGEN